MLGRFKQEARSLNRKLKREKRAKFSSSEEDAQEEGDFPCSYLISFNVCVCLYMHMCVNTQPAHVDVVERKIKRQRGSSVRLEGDSDRTSLIADRPAPAAICFICVR